MATIETPNPMPTMTQAAFAALQAGRTAYAIGEAVRVRLPERGRVAEARVVAIDTTSLGTPEAPVYVLAARVWTLRHVAAQPGWVTVERKVEARMLAPRSSAAVQGA